MPGLSSFQTRLAYGNYIPYNPWSRWHLYSPAGDVLGSSVGWTMALFTSTQSWCRSGYCFYNCYI